MPNKCPRQNVYDALQDTTLDCELLAIRDLNAAAITTGTVAKIGLIAFAGTNTDTLSPLNITSAAALDLSPLGGVTTLTPPAANDFTPPAGMTTVFTPQTNLDWVVQSAYINTAHHDPWARRLAGARSRRRLHAVRAARRRLRATNYTAALVRTLNVLRRRSRPAQNIVVAFLSDGIAEPRRSPGR